MAHQFTEHRVVSSLLDRLLDDDPRTKVEAPSREGQVIRETRESLRRDLTDLLNARRPLPALPPGCPHLPSSLANYGLPDLQSSEIREDHNVLRLCRLIEECIDRFEPRLRDVRVSPLDANHSELMISRRFQFSIEAVFVTDALREPVQYLSHVDAASGTINVEGTA
jgi:type VI secretion system protein ImpF